MFFTITQIITLQSHKIVSIVYYALISTVTIALNDFTVKIEHNISKCNGALQIITYK